ncbi:unnamed protein product, partial [Iphiclides podalirius]
MTGVIVHNFPNLLKNCEPHAVSVTRFIPNVIQFEDFNPGLGSLNYVRAMGIWPNKVAPRRTETRKSIFRFLLESHEDMSMVYVPINIEECYLSEICGGAETGQTGNGVLFPTVTSVSCPRHHMRPLQPHQSPYNIGVKLLHRRRRLPRRQLAPPRPLQIRREHLQHSNAGPFGREVRFLPQTSEEYRIIQRHLAKAANMLVLLHSSKSYQSGPKGAPFRDRA